MTEDERLNHCYLGDGVYIECTPCVIILRTGNHQDHLCDNKIYMEHDVVGKMIEFLLDRKIIKFESHSILRSYNEEELSRLVDNMGKESDALVIEALKQAEAEHE